jgi:hypothetical protein
MTAGKVMAFKTSGGPFTNLGGIPAADITTDTALNLTVTSITVPADFTDCMFSVLDTKEGDGKFTATVSSVPSNGGSSLTDIDVSLDGGSTWPLSLGAATAGTYLVQGTYKSAHNVKMRARNAVGPGNANPTSAPVTPKGIRIVGFITGAIASGSSANTKSNSLTALTGGVRSAAQAGDFVLGLAAGAAGAEITFAVTSTGYTDVRTRQYANGQNDATLLCSYKYLSGADTTIDWGSFTGNGAQGKVFHAVVLEGVDSTTPLDGVTPVPATATNTGHADLGNITIATLGAWIMACYASGFGSTAKTYGAPANMTQLTNTQLVTGTRSVSGIIATKKPTSIAAFNPDALTTASGAADSTNDTYCSVAFSLKPE